MKIKVSKILLESALIFQAKKDVRYYLNGICFKADGRVCSTDGHRAFVGGKHEGEIGEDVILSVTKAQTKNYDYAHIDTEIPCRSALGWLMLSTVDSLILIESCQRK